MYKRIVSLCICILMLVNMMPAITYASESVTVKWNDGVTGGAIYFDPSTGTIIDCDESVTKVNIPEKIEGVEVKAIGDSAFYLCMQLQEINMPNTVTILGKKAFQKCEALTNITVSNNLKVIDDHAFSWCLNATDIDVPSSVTYMGENAFYHCDSLKEIYIPEGIKEIKKYTFNACRSLKSIELPQSVESIGNCAFYACNKLERINIPSNVKSIGSSAFYNCTNLEQILLPNGITSVEYATFGHCSNLSNVCLPDRLETISRYAFEGCNSLRNIKIPNSVVTIGEYAFDCGNLESIVIPSSVTSIGNNGISGTSNLTIYGSYDSEAESYAKDHSINFEKAEYFSALKDGWPIGNSLEGFGYDRQFLNTNVSLETYLLKIINPSYDGFTKVMTSGLWLGNHLIFMGNCFGMALSSAAIYTNKIDKTEMFPDKYNSDKTLNEYGYSSILNNDQGYYYTIKDNKEALGFIERCHLVQANLEFLNQYEVFKDKNFQSVIEYMNNPKDERIILVNMPSVGHAVTIDKSRQMKPLENGVYMIPLYDSNCPVDSLGKLTDISDSENLKYPIERLYNRESYLVIDTKNETYKYMEYNKAGNITRDGEFSPRKKILSLKFYDVSNVDTKYLNDDIIMSSLKNVLFCSTANFVMVDNAKTLLNISKGIINEIDPSILNIVKFSNGNEISSDNEFYAIKCDDYNNSISIEDGMYFVTDNDSFCGIFVDGKIDSKLDLEKNKIVVTPLEDDCNVSINIQDDFSSEYKTANVEVSLDKNEQVVLQNNEGALIVDAPEKVIADIEIDNAGVIEKEENVVLEKINGHIIGEETLKDSVEHECKWTAGKITKKANCIEAGKLVKNCLICDAQHSEIIPKLGHNYGSSYIIDTKATFSTNGSKSKHCIRTGCDAKTAVTIIPKISSVSLSTTKYTYNGYNKTPSATVKDSKGNILKKGTDYNVSYASKRWDVGRYKVTVTFKGNYSGTKALYYTIVPKAATNTKANLYGYDDVKVTWSKARGASGYFVYYKKSSSSKYTYYGRTTKNSMKIANFTDGIKYNFKVVPYYYSSSNKTRYSSLQSTVASVYTLKKVSTPTIIKNGTKVKVKWSNINGETGYQISRSTKKTSTNIVSTYKTSSGTYKNISASKGKTYYYKVRAYKVVDGKKICGPWSKVKSYKRK